MSAEIPTIDERAWREEVKDLEHARRVLLEIRELEQETAELEMLAERIRQQYVERFEQLQERIDARKELLKGYVENGRGGRGFNIPDAGKVHLRQNPRKLIVKPSEDDRAAFDAWCEATDRVKTEPDWKAVVAHWKDTGEMPPGTTSPEPTVALVVSKAP